MEKGCRVNRGPLGALDSFEGSMCGITHKMSRSCMTCMTIHDVKNVIIQIQRVMENCNGIELQCMRTWSL